MEEMPKEYRPNFKEEQPVVVVVLELEGYGSIIIEQELWAKKGSNERVIAREHGIDPNRISNVDYFQTRTREYLNNLPAFSGNK